MERPTALNMIYAGDGQWAYMEYKTPLAGPNVLQGFLSGGEEQNCVHIQQEK